MDISSTSIIPTLSIKRPASMALDSDDGSLCSSSPSVDELIKRRRVSCSPHELDYICQHVVSWLRRSANHGLPRTPDAFVRAVAPMCVVSGQADAQIVFYHLLLNNVIVFTDDNRMTANLSNLNTNFVGFVPIDTTLSGMRGFCTGFTAALHRCANLIRTTSVLPQSNDSVIDMLRPLCSFRREIDPWAVLDELARRGLVCSRGHEMLYMLPDESTPATPALEVGAAMYEIDITVG